MKYFTMNKTEENLVNDGILYFAQRIDEMLCRSTYHIYKMPVLNTQLLIKEYLRTSDLVEQGIINENHLKYIFEEFLESFNGDIIIQEYIPDNVRDSLLQRMQSCTLNERRKLMHYALHLLSKYNFWCKEYIKKIAPQEREKKKIERVLRCYLPGLIAYGYDPDFIYYYNKTIFNQKGKSDVDLLDEFLDKFTFKKKKYDVYVVLNKKAAEFKEILTANLRVIFDFDLTEARELKYHEKKYMVVKMEIEALDKYEAAHHAYESLNLFFKFYKFMGDERGRWCYNKCMVKLDDNDFAFIDLKIQRYHFPYDSNSAANGRASALTISALLCVASSSFETIEKVIDLHNNAIENTDLSNGFLNLWSILEILFVNDKDCAKINEIEKKMIPIIQKEYIIMIFKGLDEALHDNLNPEQYRSIMERIGGSDNKYKTAALVTLCEYEDLRKELNDYLINFPILRSRISQMSQLCKRKIDFKNDLDRFTRRVTWHLMRLYRTRNSIIHSGEMIPNLKPLGEHLHSYVDACVWEIIVSLVSEKHLGTIENAIIDQMIQMENIIKELSEREEFTRNDLFLCCNTIQYSNPNSPEIIAIDTTQ